MSCASGASCGSTERSFVEQKETEQLAHRQQSLLLLEQCSVARGRQWSNGCYGMEKIVSAYILYPPPRPRLDTRCYPLSQHGGKLTGAVKAASFADVGIVDIPVPDLPEGTWDDFWNANRAGGEQPLRRGVVGKKPFKLKGERILRSAGQVSKEGYLAVRSCY